MTLAEEAESELKRAKGPRGEHVHFSDEGIAICRVLEDRMQAMSRRLSHLEKRCQDESA